jgi:hypothetical protein
MECDASNAVASGDILRDAGTHWDDCYRVHPRCSAAKMARDVFTLAAEVRRLRVDIKRCNAQQLALDLIAERARNRALEQAISWALGEGDSNFERPVGAPAYWWRSELRARAALAGGKP